MVKSVMLTAIIPIMHHYFHNFGEWISLIYFHLRIHLPNWYVLPDRLSETKVHGQFLLFALYCTVTIIFVINKNRKIFSIKDLKHTVFACCEGQNRATNEKA